MASERPVNVGVPNEAGIPAGSDVPGVGSPNETFLDRIGIPAVLKWGFLGVLVLMTGNGVESNFLTPHLVKILGSPEATVSVIIAFYSVAVLLASYLSGSFSDLYGRSAGST